MVEIINFLASSFCYKLSSTARGVIEQSRVRRSSMRMTDVVFQKTSTSSSNTRN